MTRHAFKMKLKPGFTAEYHKRHAEIWPELAQLLLDSGIAEYSIFLDEETLTLFAVQTLKPGHSTAELPQHPIVKRWWTSMVDLMEVNPDDSPVCVPLAEMFHLP